MEQIEHYRNKIIEAVKNCNDLEVLAYLEAFNRLYIEKHDKESEG